MKNKSFTSSLILFFLILFLTSCTKNLDLNPNDSNDLSSLKALKESFGQSSIKSFGSKYLIQGDMVVDKSDINLISDKISSKNNRTSNIRSQQAYESKVTVNSISVYIDPSITINSDWVNAVNVATSDWNSISNFGLQFSVNTTNSSSDISIIGGTVPTDEIVIADLPISGAPGATITIDLSQSASTDYMRLKIAHALGHTIGFRHTDYYGESGITYIPGSVPATSSNSNPDFISVMNSTPNFYVQQWIGFSPQDLLSIRTVYPLDNTQIPIYRYYKNARHFYTGDWNELGYNNQNWNYEGYEGFVFNTSGYQRVQIYRYYASGTGDYLYTTNWNELQNGRYGYGYEGILGWAYNTQVSGTVPLHRFSRNIRGLTLHFYARNYSEGSGWTYEGVCCYVLQ
jgi:hypothetical protein